jgi:hypothetical protein
MLMHEQGKTCVVCKRISCLCMVPTKIPGFYVSLYATFAIAKHFSNHMLPPANELFANQEKHSSFLYEKCAGCLGHFYYKYVKNVIGMCWLCLNCHEEMKRTILLRNYSF